MKVKDTMYGKWYIVLILLPILSSAFAAKATELIFRKTTTTTTTEAPQESAGLDNIEPHNETSVDDGDETKSKLTGIPQIDYIHDPNLPRELKGYNLSTYPFLEEVPPEAEVDFICDGLHDGFYASVKFHCQLYHHCLYGIRYDFLCANFTAFDQKTFICHFASEVDCKNSPRYFYRNDVLYKATTAATPEPTTSTTTTTTTTTTTAKPPKAHKGQRPYRRRPVIYDDYYYDDYEEKPLRYRPRQPDLEEEYEFEDERIISRRPNNRKRKYYGGGRRKSYVERIPIEYEYDYEEPVVKVQVKKKVNASLLENRNKENRNLNEEKTTVKPIETGKGGLFSQPRNPSRLGIKIRRDPLAASSVTSTTTTTPKPMRSNVKEYGEVEYSYEDYADEVEKQPQEEEVVEEVEEKLPRPKQSRLPLIARKHILTQRRTQ